VLVALFVKIYINYLKFECGVWRKKDMVHKEKRKEELWNDVFKYFYYFMLLLISVSN